MTRLLISYSFAAIVAAVSLTITYDIQVWFGFSGYLAGFFGGMMWCVAWDIAFAMTGQRRRAEMNVYTSADHISK